MKFLFLAAFAAFTLFAQEKKATHDERPLTADEVWHARWTISEIDRINQKFEITKYHGEVDPVTTDQQSMILEWCKSVGVSDMAKVQSGECQFTTGIGPDGKPINDATGKPIPPRVWRVKPPEPAKPEKK